MKKSMIDLNQIYEENKKLDKIFEEKYLGKEPLMFEKNCIEFLTELGELSNETRCFKYWSIKEPNYENMLEEYADCLIMALYFYRYLDLEIDDIPLHKDTKNILEIVNYLFELGSKLMNNCNEKNVKLIFSNLLYLGSLLGFKDQEQTKMCKKKQTIIKERLDSNY